MRDEDKTKEQLIEDLKELRQHYLRSELEQSETLVETLLNATHDSAYLLDLDGNFLAANKLGAERMSKISTEWLGKNIKEVFPPDVLKIREAKRIEVIQSRQPVHFEDEREGSYLDNHVYPVFDSQGKIIQLAVFSQDITERRQAETALRESVERYRTLIENAPLCIHEIDLNGRLTSMNPVGLKMVGATEEQEIIGLAYCDYASGKDRQHLEKLIAEAYQGKVSVFEFSSSSIPPQIFQSCFIPIRDEKGEIVKLMGITEDITERKQAEEKLRSSEEKYKTLIENAPLAVFVAQDDRIKFANLQTEKLYGYSEAELASKGFIHFLHKEDQELVLERHRRRLRGEVLPNTYSFRIITKAGEMKWVELKVIPFNWEDRPATLCFQTDVTEREQLETKLRQSHKMEALGTLAGGIAHDFNNMLSVILGSAEMGLTGLPQESKESRALERILEAGERATSLVRQILIFSRMEALHLKPVTLSSVVKETLKMAKATLPAQIEIHQDLPEEDPPIMADTTQIHQILFNLYTNASHAMEATGGTLEVRIEELDQCPPFLNIGNCPCLKLTVKDTGPGIPPEIQVRVFDPFFTTKEVGKGTGMGLSVVHGIVEQHQGAITVESELGQGTTFSVFFPIIREEALEKPAKEVPVKKDSGDSPLLEASAGLTGGPDPASTDGHFGVPADPIERMPQILVVEDEPAISNTYKAFLEDCGYGVTICGNGSEALALFKENSTRFDLVLTDQSMPSMTGQQLAKELITLQPNLPIILSTGYSDIIFEKEAHSMGILKFLMKPLKLATLRETIEECLETIR